MRSTILAFAIVLSTIAPAGALAQVPSPFGPPSFGTDYLPDSPVFNFEMRRYRDWQLTINLSVPTAQLQAVLPAGYLVVNPAAERSVVTIAMVLQERVEFQTSVGGIAAGSYGPVDEVLVVASARSPAGLNESVILYNLRSTPEAVNMTNAVYGAGSARLPDLLRIELAAQPGGQQHRFTATAVAGPLHIGASAIFDGSEILMMRKRLSPDPFRYVDGSTDWPVANGSLRASTSGDLITVQVANITFKRDEIRLPQGTLTVLGIVSGRIFRWQEFVQKLQ